MSRNSLLETGAKSEGEVTATGLESEVTATGLETEGEVTATDFRQL